MDSFYPKLQLSLYKLFRRSFMTYYVVVEKVVLWTSALQMSGKKRNHSYCCLVFGQNQYTKRTEHLCLPNKQLQLALVWVSTWSCNVTWVKLWSSKAYASRTHFLDACIMLVFQKYLPMSYSLQLSQSGLWMPASSEMNTWGFL